MKHIEALWGVLIDLTELDPFSKIDSKYKEKLTFEDEKAISDFFMDKDSLTENDKEALRNVLKLYIMNHLTEKTTSNNIPLYEILGYLEIGDSFIVDLNWFSKFPKTILMSCALEAYQLMVSLS